MGMIEEKEIILKLNDHEHEIVSLKHRIKAVEDNQKALSDLIRSVDKLANSMENMVSEQKEQGIRLERLENAPADDFKYYKRLIVGCVLTGVIGAVLGALIALVIK